MKTLHPEDRALVDRLLAGDERAFERFFDDYVPRLYRFALSRVDGDGDLAEEVVQSALARVFPKLGTYRGEAALSTWLCTFCAREASAYFRRHAGSPRQVELPDDEAYVTAALDVLRTADRPDDALLRREVGDLVRSTLDLLPARYGDVLEWKYMEGLSVKEIAARCQETPTAVQSLLARARLAFRTAFAVTAGAALPAQR